MNFDWGLFYLEFFYAICTQQILNLQWIELFFLKVKGSPGPSKDIRPIRSCLFSRLQPEESNNSFVPPL